MPIYTLITIIITVTAIFAYLNTKWLKLPSIIGLMLISIIFSVVLGILNYINPTLISPLIQSINDLDFSAIVLDVLLSFLLFAGALHTDFNLLKKQKNSVIVFAIAGVILSTLFIGAILFWTAMVFHLKIPFIYCLLFGSFISPTDPIAVLGILTKAKVPKQVETTIVGESLFNDGIGVVLFITILSIINTGFDDFGTIEIVKLFAVEAVGGVVFGFLLGYIIYLLLKSIDDYETEVIITLSIVMGGSLAASYLHFSAPLAMVVAGLMTGHKTKEVAMSDTTKMYVDKFWHLIDVLLNAVLFVLMGLKILSIQFEWHYVWITILLIPLFIAARYLALFIPHLFTSQFLSIQRKDLVLMTWGGLRGGLSIAMALSLSNSLEHKNLFVAITYGTVIFSIFFQGLSIQKLVQKMYKK